VATGDNNNSNGAATAWQTYFRDAAAMFRNVPYFAAMGNHDNYSSWSTYNVSPQSSSGSDAYFALVYGNAGFVAVNPNAAYGAGTAQNSWVVSALQTFKGGPLFTFQHQGMFSCGTHGSDTSIQAALQSAYEQNGVATSFNGHDHDLIFWSTVNGVRYVVSGGGGTSLYPLKNCQGPYALQGYGFMIVTVNGSSITETFYDDTGKQLYANPAFNAAGTTIDFSKIGSLTVY
jgi:tartrate-resistant acid phosphatase type 5